MGSWIEKQKNQARLWIQLSFTLVTNSYVKGFLEGKIYTGSTKSFCAPGLNCYSCPGALGSCPIGALQAVLGSRDYRFSFYVIGFLLAVGALLGRFVCGWLCPFGLMQDLLHRIPWKRKIRHIPGEKMLRLLKYVILLVFVILLPIFAVDAFGLGAPWFCQWICPSGTLMAGWPLVVANEGLRSIVGGLFLWKNAILITLLVLSVVVYRPFCRFLCPLGAIYGLMNPIAIYGYQINEQKCTGCKKCQKSCEMNIPVYQHPNHQECIRCGKCLHTCPEHAICRKYFSVKENVDASSHK